MSPKLHKTLSWAIVLSEASHVFCCVLPTIFSLLGLLAGLGFISVMPIWLHDLHEILHGWEIPILIISGSILALAWGLQFYSHKIDCHETGCHHGPCDTKKSRSKLILKIGTLLFAINICVYVLFHSEMAVIKQPHSPHIIEDVHHDDHGH